MSDYPAVPIPSQFMEAGEPASGDSELQRIAARLARAEQVARFGSWEWDIRSGQMSWSDELYRIFGMEVGSWPPTLPGFLRRVHPDDVAAKSNELAQALSAGGAHRSEYRIILPDGSVRTLESRFEVQLDAGGSPERVLGTAKDVTERRRAEQALEAANAQLAAIIGSAIDPVITVDAAGRVIVFNAAAERMFGVAREDALGEPIGAFIPRLAPSGMHRLGAHADRSGGLSTFSARHRSGEVIPVEAAVSRVEVRGETLYTIMLRDIADRQRAEAALLDSHAQLRSLADRLASVREEERTRISREIHDELGQALTALRFDLVWLRGRSGDEAGERVRAMLELVDGTVGAVRRISNDLRPGILDDLGLAAAIEWQAQQFSLRSGVKCVLRLLADPSDLDEHRSTTLFRVFQEALTNVARHAQARRVTIVLHHRNDALELSLADDGRGISEADRQRPGSLGLVGMRERVRACGGDLSVTRRKRGGTILAVRLPLRREGERREA